jgi:hypothetical protein
MLLIACDRIQLAGHGQYVGRAGAGYSPGRGKTEKATVGLAAHLQT